MKQTAFLAIFLMLLTAALPSCDSARIFDQYQKIPGAAWHKDSLIHFHIPVTDTLQKQNLLIQIRNETTYQYSNLWLFIEITQPGGKVVRDTFEVALAEPSGRWLGDGFGGIKTLQTRYRSNFWFPVAGDYSISLQHGMREEILKGIHDVGIRIEKTGRRG
jgi:gliding motility-associated lipoprotein GldH